MRSRRVKSAFEELPGVADVVRGCAGQLAIWRRPTGSGRSWSRRGSRFLRTRENLAPTAPEGAASAERARAHASSELLGENDPLPDGDAFAAALDGVCLEPDDFSEEAEVIAEDDGEGGVRGRPLEDGVSDEDVEQSVPAASSRCAVVEVLEVSPGGLDEEFENEESVVGLSRGLCSASERGSRSWSGVKRSWLL